MSESIKKGRFTYRRVGGSYVRIPPEDPPRTYQMGARGEFVRQPRTVSISGGSVRSRMTPVALRKPIPGQLRASLSEEEEEEVVMPPPPRKKKAAKKEVPRVIRGVNFAGEETDTEYEYEAPRKRKPVTSNVVVSKKSKSVQTTSKMAYLAAYPRQSKSGTDYFVYRLFTGNLNDKGEPESVAISNDEADTTYKKLPVETRPASGKTYRKREGVSAPVKGYRKRRLEDVNEILDYDRGLIARTSGVHQRPDSRLIPASHIKYVAKQYGIPPADVGRMIAAMDAIAIDGLTKRDTPRTKTGKIPPYRGVVGPTKASITAAQRAKVREALLARH